MTQITLEAPDISCDHCIASIEKALAKLPGVQFRSGDPAAKQVTIEYDPTLVDRAAIDGAMEDEGYPVTR
jgi:copper chaperone